MMKRALVLLIAISLTVGVGVVGPAWAAPTDDGDVGGDQPLRPFLWCDLIGCPQW